MQQLLNWRLKFVMKDGRTMIGQLIAWDRFMNVVLSDCEEFRLINTKGKKRKADGGNEEKRTLGLVILRGENIVSVVPESPPPATEGRRVPASTVLNMPGIARPGGRGMPIVPPMGAPAGMISKLS
jgi:small nuclear ribonucleoprotein B and B'